MSDFVVSARKYRPSTFDTVVGQQGITNTLKNAIKNNHLAQAFLFCGPRGVGKTTCARILAKTINCTNLTPQVEACDNCESCKSFNEGHSLNVFELDAASNNSVDDIRNLIDQVRFAPQLGDFKVYIIDEVHMLSQAAFNAFLKTLEEPPKHAIFILATTERHKIIPTILSRCQIFDFSRIKISDMVEHLASIAVKEGVSAEHDALHIIAQKADGGLRDALSIFDQMVSFSGNTVKYQDVIDNLNILDYDYYFTVCDYVFKGNYPAALMVLDEIIRKGFNGHLFIVGMSSHIRNLLVSQNPQTISLLEVGDNIKEKYLKQSQSVAAPMLIDALNIANDCDLNYKSSKNQRLLVELALIKMSTLTMLSEKKNDQSDLDFVLPIFDRATGQLLELTKKLELPSSHQPAPAAYKTEVTEVPKVEEPKKVTTASNLNDLRSKLNGLSSININEKLKEQKKEVKQEGEEVISGPKSSFEMVAFENAWKSYIIKMEKGGKTSFASLLTKRVPKLKKDFDFELTVDNMVENDIFNGEKQELLDYLRNQLNNFHLKIFTTVTQTEYERKPYTTKEKYVRLAEKNPLLNKLQKNLDLDLDY